jgi:hypothetical protein
MVSMMSEMNTIQELLGEMLAQIRTNQEEMKTNQESMEAKIEVNKE